ncbi:MAG: hypothetical protein K9L84_01220 [Candidatus Omnitrophica bacterium]|nr:hypothetical protein [Candidatus Omnitrophota bacterium]MCF7893671.1 hypothetical protein [Candidatus Omnitrophota bacterium]
MKSKGALSFFILILTLLFSLTAYSQAPTISLKALVDNPEKYDQKRVSLKAELIGEPLTTDTGIWLNLGANDYNMGVYLAEKEMLEKAHYWGSYKEKGDIVEIEGIFYKNCPIHNQRGLHLTALEVVTQGKELSYLVSDKKKKFALVSMVIFLTIGVIYLIKISLWQKK